MRRVTRCRALLCLLLVSPGMWAAEKTAESKLRSEMEKANAAFEKHEYEEALKRYKKASKTAHHGSAEACRGVIQAAFKLRDHKAAEEAARNLLLCAESDGIRADAHNVIGLVYFQSAREGDSEKLQKAEKEFRAAVRLSPDFAVAQFNLAYALLRQGRESEGVELLRKYLELAPALPSAPLARRLISKPRLAKFDIAPEISATGLDGEAIPLSRFEGKIVLVDFWATWCPPCKAALPGLRKLAKKFPAEQFVLFSVSLDGNESKWRQFIKQNSMDWPQARDPDASIYEQFRLAPRNIYVIPRYVLIDGDGAIRKRLESEYSLEKEIARLLAETDDEGTPRN